MEENWLSIKMRCIVSYKCNVGIYKECRLNVILVGCNAKKGINEYR